MALTKVTGQVIKNTTDVTVGVLTVTNTLAVGGTVSIGGTLTYEDVTNIDSVGLITARNGIVVGSGITLSKDGDIFATGVTTATKFVGDGSELTGVASTENIRTNTNATFLQNINVSGTSTIGGDVNIADKIVHIGDTDTAIRFPSADTFTVETAGGERLRVKSDGSILHTAASGSTIHTLKRSNANVSGATGTINFAASDDHSVASIMALGDGDNEGAHLSFRTTTAAASDDPYDSSIVERLRIGSDGTSYVLGDFGVGTNSPQSAGLTVENSSEARLRVRAGSNASNGEVALRADGGNTQLGTWSDHDLKLVRNTTEVASLTTNGISFPSGKGIDFSATGDGSGTMTNELLDDYEEGTWSISVTPGGGSFSVSHMNARYVRIGNVVTVQGWWRADSISGVSGSLTVSGLPYATLDYSSGGGVRQSLILNVAHVNYSGLTFVKFRIGNNSTQGSILANTSGASGGFTTWTAGNIALSSELYISGSYITG